MIQSNRQAMFENLTLEEDDLSLKAYRALAVELKIHLHIGSLALRVSPERAVNRSFLIAPDGTVIASYDKIHMFDIDLPGGESYRESANYQPGETAVIADLPWGRIGLTICYDVRFPALYRALAESGASFLTVPSAFTVRTGEAHWHTLLRARAIENGCFVFAAAQAGTHESKRQSYGHSLIIDPWGAILAEGSATETGVFLARIDPSKVETARKTVPSLQHGRRFSIADPKAGPEHLHLVRGSA
jgi:predicted amidohydrolase